MAERKRSNDGSSDVEQYLPDVETPEHAGRTGGDLEREVATRDEQRQVENGKGSTRVTKENEQGQGNLGGLHGTGDSKGS